MTRILNSIVGLLFIGTTAFAQLTEFSQGDILSAGSMNQNFKYLEAKLGGINETIVNCGTDGNGYGINDAIQKGYNSIVINGICKENIKLDGREGNVLRLLKLRGANNDYTKDKIIDNSRYTEHILDLDYTVLLILSSLFEMLIASISGFPISVESVNELDQKPSNSCNLLSTISSAFSAIKAEIGL